MSSLYRSFRRPPTHDEAELALAQMAIAGIIRTVKTDPVVLLEVVCGGHQHWRLQFMRAMRGHRLVTEDIADAIFKDFCETVVSLYGGMTEAKKVLDQVEVHEHRPPTQREIDESWSVESWSSEEGRRYFYGADHPDQIVRTLTVH